MSFPVSLCEKAYALICQHRTFLTKRETFQKYTGIMHGKMWQSEKYAGDHAAGGLNSLFPNFPSSFLSVSVSVQSS